MKTGMRVRITLFSILRIMYYNTFRCAVFIEGVHARKARPLLTSCIYIKEYILRSKNISLSLIP